MPTNPISDPNDYNCDGSVAYADADADGWAACMECDDSDANINPDAVEICDEIDNDCDSATDDADDSLDSETATPWYADTDTDGFGDLANSVLLCERPTGYVAADNTDCDDTNASLYPGAVANIVTVKACIDGSDWLYVKGTSLWWVHRNHDKVGQHSDCGSFTYTVVDGTNWSHSWSGNTTNTYSGMGTNLPATAALSVSVSNPQGCGSISVTQQPSASNGYTAAVLFNDDGPGGAASYQITLSATCQ